MRVLLDENLPIDLAAILPTHEVETVVGLGWAGVKNGELLRRAAERFDALITMDSNLEYQQPIYRLALGVVVISASSNRMHTLTPLIPSVLTALDRLGPGEVLKVS
jgi:predicted nuclease of predicted toxin-antitoxin system